MSGATGADLVSCVFRQVYEELRTIKADAAEPKARRILSGLGFSKAMQVQN